MCDCQCTCLLVAGALLVAAFIFRYVVVRGQQCTSQARLGGKTVIVTGELRSAVYNERPQNKQNKNIYNINAAFTLLGQCCLN